MLVTEFESRNGSQLVSVNCAPTLIFWEDMLTDESSTYALPPVAARYMLLYLLNCAITLCHAIRRQTLSLPVT
jgi:hypothetical protein